MHVRAAHADDLPAVERMYASAIDAMRGTPFDIEWEMGWHPSRERLLEAVSKGDLIVAVPDDDCEGLPVTGAFILDGSQEAGYAQAAWLSSATASEVAVLHLLAVDPAVRGGGVARALVAEAARCARARGARALRLDVFDNNEPAIRLYRFCGFTDLGRYALDFDEGFSHGAHLMELDLCREEEVSR